MRTLIVATVLIIAGCCAIPNQCRAETRNYVKGATVRMNDRQLEANINSAMGWTGTQVQSGIKPTLVIVTNPLLTSANDAAINARIAAYVFDPLYDSRTTASGIIGAASDQQSLVLRAAVATLIDSLNVLRAAYPIPVTSITRSGTTATVTTAMAHNLVSGPVFMWGAPQTAYNGLQTITVTGATTFTYTVAGSPTTPATPGALVVYPTNALFSPITLSGAVNAVQTKITNGGAD